MSNSPSTAKGGVYCEGEDGSPSITAAFSLQAHASPAQQRSTILLDQKSPLLLATPPQVTRALAYSHAFIIPLNKLAALLSWTTGDPWESFLMVIGFWFVVLYGDPILRYAGPLILVLFLMFGMYQRRRSPISSSSWAHGTLVAEKTGTEPVEHRKSLDEIVSTLQAFTGRCNILLAPFLELTDFLSTPQTATSATTRPALTIAFVRIFFASPFWYALTLPPLRLITARRIVFCVGTVILTWHSRPARISRTLLWRSRFMRRLATLVTGLNFCKMETIYSAPNSPTGTTSLVALQQLKARNRSIRFTFNLYENQRRWIGLGWTSNMVAYERAPWTDEQLNQAASIDHFELPQIEGGLAKWRWVAGSSWSLEPASKVVKDKEIPKTDDELGWIYFDNKWLAGGKDGWGKFTRQRKWVRDAELVDADIDDTDEQRNNSAVSTPKKQAGEAMTKSPSHKFGTPTHTDSTRLAFDSVKSQATDMTNGENDGTAPGLSRSNTKDSKKSPFGRNSEHVRTQSSASSASAKKKESSSTHSDPAKRLRRVPSWNTDDDHTLLRSEMYSNRGGEWGLGDEFDLGFG